jgi:transcriptional regulator with XRE-family HTH domain
MSRRERSPRDEAEEAAFLAGIAAAVKHLRLQAGMTREAVAKRAGLSNPSITEVEEGLKTEPRWQTLRALATGLGIEAPDLIRLGIEMAPGKGGDLLREREREALEAEKGGAE